MLDDLKAEVLEANLMLVELGLVYGTWGNASAIDWDSGMVVIKPSGVPYESLTADQMVVVDLEGQVAEGDLRPSSDTPTHLVLYKAFGEDLGGIAHTHSHYATCWAQACRGIPCLGTTHADSFRGEVPVTGWLSTSEVAENYEVNTGRAIVRRFGDLSPVSVPGVLVAQHAPFTWGKTVAKAVETAGILEEVARLAMHTVLLAGAAPAIPGYLLDKHFLRKHGEDAYYGQEDG